MQTRRDQLQAYRYLLRRVLAAMLGSEPEALEQPMRRVSTSTFAGIMIGVLACAGVALYGWIADTRTDQWKQEAADTLIVDKDTNSIYLYLHKDALASGGQQTGQQGGEQQAPDPANPTGEIDEKDMVLVEVLNHTSARLILGKEPKVVRVASASLDDVPRGPRIGIPLAPNSVPRKDNVTSKPLTTCSTARTVNDAQQLEVDMLIGATESDLGARPIGDQALVVRSPDGSLFLIYRGKRLATDDDALRSLDLNQGTPLTVGAAWLDALEEGQPLAAPVVPGRREQSTVLVNGETTWIGQVFHSDSPDTYYVMLADGLTEITAVQADLLFGEGAAEINGVDQDEATDVTISEVNNAASETPSIAVPDLPATTPRLAEVGTATDEPVCLWYGGSREGVHITMGGELPAAPVEGEGEGSQGNSIDRVVVPPGRVAIVGLQPGPDVEPESFFLITDEGVKFPVPDQASLDALGFDGIEPEKVPSSLLRLVPEGPALSQQAAFRVASFDPSANQNDAGTAGGAGG
ncbi:type VII secretion protein EccB [Actinopolymorpha sp. B9G3]|uniref:type VII secretion protein EccB n=1 Tax=Actinopolymorpha sp. B9G3 TaxID=3158970 RepID=UPI0032D8C277